MNSSIKPTKKLTTALDGFKFALMKDDSLLVLILLDNCLKSPRIFYSV